MIAAGIGSRRDVSAEDIEHVVRLALETFQVRPESVDVLATEDGKASTAAYVEAARRLALPLVGVTSAQLGAVADRIVTRSTRALAAKGVPSIAEAAALCAAGTDARLLGARVATARATCAIAIGEAS